MRVFIAGHPVSSPHGGVRVALASHSIGCDSTHGTLPTREAHRALVPRIVIVYIFIVYHVYLTKHCRADLSLQSLWRLS